MCYGRFLLLLLTLMAFSLISAETVYRTVDKDGKVSFSDTPPEDAVAGEKVKLTPDNPSPEAQEESRQRTEQMNEMANEMQRDRTQGQQTQKPPSAQKEVDMAEQRLEDAKVVREGDRKGTASGGSRLTPEYQERVKSAEDELSRAQNNLK